MISLEIRFRSSLCKLFQVAHTFNFGTKYSDRLKTVYVDKSGKKKPLHMCSYGIGISRIFSAVVELLSTSDELRWPPAIAPYTVCVIPPKVSKFLSKNFDKYLKRNLYDFFLPGWQSRRNTSRNDHARVVQLIRKYS